MLAEGTCSSQASKVATATFWHLPVVWLLRMTTDRIPIFAVVGPTGVGKTKLCIAIAKALNGEVVSVDSLQVYRDAKVVTVRPTPQEMEGIPHHLIDCLEATEEPDNFAGLAVAAIR